MTTPPIFLAGSIQKYVLARRAHAHSERRFVDGRVARGDGRDDTGHIARVHGAAQQCSVHTLPNAASTASPISAVPTRFIPGSTISAVR